MKICVACHKDLPKESYSKKQWKLDKRRCKVCTANNREIQLTPKQKTNSNTNEIIKSLDFLCIDNVDKKISDDEEFKQPPPQYGDCPICFLLMPSLNSGHRYQSCCGTVICIGCAHAPQYDNQGNEVDNEKQNECPFCRVVAPKTDEEMMEREMKRVEAGDFIAIGKLGNYYLDGRNGYPKDCKKALELWHRAAELGFAKAYHNIGYAYDHGLGVGRKDLKKAHHYYKLAAMGGDSMARHKLAQVEGAAGNFDRAMKHHMISIRSGDNDSLEMIKDMYSKGYATKEDYTKALKLYQEYLDEIKSPHRDKAAATYEDCRYY